MFFTAAPHCSNQGNFVRVLTQDVPEGQLISLFSRVGFTDLVKVKTRFYPRRQRNHRDCCRSSTHQT